MGANRRLADVVAYGKSMSDEASTTSIPAHTRHFLERRSQCAVKFRP